MTGRHRKPPKPDFEAEVRLLDWGSRGAVDAEIDGRIVPVDRGIPGETVVATIRPGRRQRGIVSDVIEPSPLRVVAPCPYYAQGCGGCQWQHVSYQGQLEAKCAIVDREMAGAGLDCRVMSIHGMEHPWNYRRTASLAIGWEAGFRPRGRRGILEIHDCLISHPLIGRLADRLNEVLDAGALPNYHGKVWLDCTVVGSEAEPALQILIQGIEGLTLESHPELPGVAHVLIGLDGVTTVAYRHRSGDARPLVGDLVSLIEVDGRAMHLPAGAFFQTNLRLLPGVIERMRDEIRASAIGPAADVYGGVGTLGLALAADVGSMCIVELDVQAAEAARSTASAWGLGNVSFISRHAERALPELGPLDAVIVDPPRSGLDSAVVCALAAQRVPRVLYLSCAPASMARDLAALAGCGYYIRSLEIFDFYPQTYHVESLAILAL